MCNLGHYWISFPSLPYRYQGFCGGPDTDDLVSWVTYQPKSQISDSPEIRLRISQNTSLSFALQIYCILYSLKNTRPVLAMLGKQQLVIPVCSISDS